MDPDKRSQLGAHYTSREDIRTLVEPVVMKPLRREWARTRELVENLLLTGKKRPRGGEKQPTGAALGKVRNEAEIFVRTFLSRLETFKVLDPACGSGNFLYVVLQELLDLENEVKNFAMDQGLSRPITMGVGPWQLFGIEVNSYAFELAQMTVWIGYLQWLHHHGNQTWKEPILQAMTNFELKDAILSRSDSLSSRQPSWPKVDCIIGNPPFAGGKRIRRYLGDDYFESLVEAFQGRLPAFSDLCCYWFEKARQCVQDGDAKRVGLLATQSIRGGASQVALQRIKETGDIFFAISDRDWILDGANVHVSLVGFDNGEEVERELDGVSVVQINADLTAGTDTTKAKPLSENQRRSYIGIQKSGHFELSLSAAMDIAMSPNASRLCNSDVLRPYLNAEDILQRNQDSWVIDFNDMSMEEASLYEAPFEYVRRNVKPFRDKIRRERHKAEWWRFGEPRQGLRRSIRGNPRMLAIPATGKYLAATWVDSVVLPSNAVVVIVTQDDYEMGIIQSHLHQLWARRKGTQLRESESGSRYTPSTSFETFPFPERPSDRAVASVAVAARELYEKRQRWINPSEWAYEEILEFPGSPSGPWQRFIGEIDAATHGTIRYPHVVARNSKYAVDLLGRTLTNLYNDPPTWLLDLHAKLDSAVLAAYNWSPSLADEEILEGLLSLNLQRAPRGG